MQKLVHGVPDCAESVLPDQAVEDVAASGKCCVLDIDVQGARLVRASKLKAIFVFIAPPSTEELERRLRGRGTESDEAVALRMQNARAEIARCAPRRHVCFFDRTCCVFGRAAACRRPAWTPHAAAGKCNGAHLGALSFALDRVLSASISSHTGNFITVSCFEVTSCC
jgi:hypothetical protein